LPSPVHLLGDQRADANDLVEWVLGELVPKRLASSSFVGLVKTMHASNGGQVRDGFDVPDEDVREWALHAKEGSTDRQFVK
jgi:hypothetical protein